MPSRFRPGLFTTDVDLMMPECHSTDSSESTTNATVFDPDSRSVSDKVMVWASSLRPCMPKESCGNM